MFTGNFQKLTIPVKLFINFQISHFTKGVNCTIFCLNLLCAIIKILHNILGEDRGPVLEVIVSRTNFISSHTTNKLRIIGLSTALANAKDLADWLGIDSLMGMFNFRPSVRPVPLEVHISGKN